MHIHSYQIHNVLNVYRQQLSRGTVRQASGKTDSNRTPQDRIDLSDHRQRQTLFEKISSEIVQRITQFGPDTEMNTANSGQSSDTPGRVRAKAEASDTKSPAFSYTLIDSNNKKTTHNLSIRQLNYATEKINSLTTAPLEGNSFPGSE
jgi:hypothetical protein